jgi:arylsulfatase A
MDMGTTMDLMPTFCKLSGSKLPNDRIYDGYDISPALLGTGESPRDIVFITGENRFMLFERENTKPIL